MHIFHSALCNQITVFCPDPILKTAIDLVVNNCRQQFYGSDSTSPTGPGVLGRAIVMHGKTENHYDGHFLMLTPNHIQRNRAYVLHNGMILAWHRTKVFPLKETLTDVGFKGCNNYRELWAEKKVYKHHI